MKPKHKTPNSREERLKLALKANIARRKEQAAKRKARASEIDNTEKSDGFDTGKGG